MGRKFTIIGEKNSGKTCYLLALYTQMGGQGINGYTIVTHQGEKSAEFIDISDNLINMDLSKDERFPPATNAVDEYDFNLCFNHETIMSFNWIDYPGGNLIKTGDVSAEQYEQVAKNIQESSVLFICIDGALLSKKYEINEKQYEIRDKIQKLNKLSIKVNTYFNKYISSGKKMPPVGFIITKYDICSEATSIDVLKQILPKAFSAFFTSSENLVGVIPVSLGMNISDDNYRGRFEPQDVHLPIFMGIHFALHDQIKADQDNLKKVDRNTTDINTLRRIISADQCELLNLQNTISALKTRKAKEEDHFFSFMIDKELVGSLKANIADAEKRAAALEDKIATNQRKISSNETENKNLKNLISNAQSSGNNFIEYLNQIIWFYGGEWHKSPFGGAVK